MASWMAWATMVSPIQLSLPALEINSVYNPFSSTFPFTVAFSSLQCLQVQWLA